MISIKNIPKTRIKSDGTFYGMVRWLCIAELNFDVNMTDHNFMHTKFIRHRDTTKKIKYYHLVFRSISCSPLRTEFLCRVAFDYTPSEKNSLITTLHHDQEPKKKNDRNKIVANNIKCRFLCTFAFTVSERWNNTKIIPKEWLKLNEVKYILKR